MLLNDDINHEKISQMDASQLKALCRELRGVIMRTVMKNGGHLSSNLGAVEMSVALHYVYDVFGGDSIIWDVGHQAYAHKLLTGRFSRFNTLRQRGGISGFTRRSESEADASFLWQRSALRSYFQGRDRPRVRCNKSPYSQTN